jgi:hypothetical protein
MDLYILWDSVDLCVSKNQELTQKLHREAQRYTEIRRDLVPEQAEVIA